MQTLQQSDNPVANGSDAPVLEVKDFKVYYDVPEGTVKAVDGVSFILHQGERLAIVGESGSGKSTMAMGLMRLIKPPGRIAGGQAWLNGEDLLSMSEEEMRLARLSNVALVPQGAMNSLNPVVRVEEQMIDGITDHSVIGEKQESRKKLQEKVAALLRYVGLSESVARMYPHELSGGMKQRVAIATAVSLTPSLIVADEPTSALDVVVQRQIMQTLGEVQEGINASVLLIGHDMGLVAQFANTVGIMYAGKLVELAPVSSIFKNPIHEYSRLLIESLPILENKKPLVGIPGTQPSLLNLPPGDAFAPRSPLSYEPEDVVLNPPFVQVEENHWVQLSRASVANYDAYAHLLDGAR